MKILLLLTISLISISCKFDSPTSEVKKISYEEEYDVEFIMDYDNNCKASTNKLNSPACARAAKKYCQKKFGSLAIGMPLSMSKIGITISCIRSQKEASIDKNYLKSSNSKCNIDKNWKSQVCQYSYQNYCRNIMASSNPDGRYKYTAIATNLSQGKVEVSCVKVSQETPFNRLKTLTSRFKCDPKDLTSEACLSSYHNNCPKDRMVGMLSFEKSVKYDEDY